jgi:Protein of unknown function DUF262
MKGMAMGLQQEIDTRRSEIKTDGYVISIGEWMNLYENNELDVHPEFQRFFRWSDSQKTKLIESILLGIPVPPIFVAQREDGVWDVVDGVQRLSTIFQFAGLLKDEEGNQVDPLVLEKTKYLPALEGKKWEDTTDSESSFTTAQRLYVKRSKIGVSIILKESDEKSKFELFQRLNSGSPLSDQEGRNCILVMVNRQMYLWMRNLSRDDNFKECIALTDRAIDEQYDLELVLRFLVFRSMEEVKLRNIGDLTDFLTDTMIDLAKSEDYDYAEEERAFKKTFEVLARTAASDSFKRYDPNKDRFLGGFLVSAFEAIGIGLGHHYQQWDDHDVILKEKIKSLWQMPDFPKSSGSGVRASTRIPKIIPFGREIFKQ